MTFHVPEKWRVKTGPMGSTQSAGNNGQFIVRSLKLDYHVLCQASCGLGWEHVSVSMATVDRCPTWAEMSVVKSIFWDDDDLVVQFHPPRSEYVNNHPYVLHLWRKAGTNDFCERPPVELV